MDLSKLSTEDLIALKNGDITKVSTEGLTALKSMQQPQSQGGIGQAIGNLGAGALRGVAGIGATIAQPFQAMAGGALGNNAEMRKNLDVNLQKMGAEPDSLFYQGGKLGTEIAATAPVGGALGGLVKGLSQSPRALQLAEALKSGGLSAQGASMPIRMAGGAATGAASAGLVDPESATTGGIIGAALPASVKMAGALGQKIGSKLVGTSSPEVRRLAQEAEQLGINIPADRLTNSKPLNALASSLNYVPFSGRAATEEAMQNQLNKAVSKTIGQNTDNVTLALDKARSDLGGKFDTVLQNNKVLVDNTLKQDLMDKASQAASELGADGARIIQNQIDEILAKGANGEIDGQAAYNIKRTLDRIGKRNSPEAFYANDLKRSLMGALDRSLGANEAKEFAKVREQYGNMLTLEKLAQKNGIEGDVSIARLANADIRSPELKKLADISQQFLKSREGQHGAAQRVTLGALSLGLSGPTGLAAAAGGGKLANALLNSQTAKKAVTGQMNNKQLVDALQAMKPLAYQGAQLNGQ